MNPFDFVKENKRKIDRRVRMSRIYDLVVAGGGMSGVAAAVAAARRGLKVLLVEQSSMLGGLGTSGLMTMLMTSKKYFYGIGCEIIDYLIKKGAARKIDDYPIRDYQRIPYDCESMKRALDDIVLESGAELLLYAKITGVEIKDNRLTQITINGQTGDFTVSGRIFVDATGDAMLAFYADEPLKYGTEDGATQAPTMTAYYANVDFDQYEKFLATFGDGPSIPKVNMIHALIPKAVKDGVISIEDYHHPGIFRISNSHNIGVMNAGHVYGAECLSPQGLTEATVKGRKMAAEYLEFYRKYIPGFENAYMTNTGSSLGLRETRRLVGEYVTTFEDKVAYKKFDDAIMRFDGGPVSDVHASSSSKEAYNEYYNLFMNRSELREDDWATLPYRSLLPQKTKNLIIAGRCVSVDRKVLGQIRIMGYCYMMGQAAGLAAALSLQNNVNLCDLDVSLLQNELKKDGVETI